MVRLSASEAMDRYERPLHAVPGVSSVHVGFEGENPTLIVTVNKINEPLLAEIHRVAPGAPIEVIAVTGAKAQTKPLKHEDVLTAYQRHGEQLLMMPEVMSVNVGRKGGKPVLIVRAHPLHDSTRTKVARIVPGVPVEFKETPHAKTSPESIGSFIGQRLWKASCLLVLLMVALAIFSPMYGAVGDIGFAVAAKTVTGKIVEAAKPEESWESNGDLVQMVKGEFQIGGRTHYFAEEVALLKTGSNLGNLNADPYHPGARVTIAYLASAPDRTARIFDPMKFMATLAMYGVMLAALVAFAIHAAIRWQEW